MLFLCIVSTILLLLAFIQEFKGYLKSPHSEWEVVLHLVQDSIEFGIPLLTIWLVYATSK